MPKKLKILYHHRIAAQDGQSVHIHELTKAFKALGHELIFVGPSLRPKEFGDENKFLDLVRKVLPHFAQEFLELLYGRHAYKKLKQAYEEHNPDVLYERHNLFLTAGSKLKRKTGIPYLVEVNAPLMEERSRYNGLHLKGIAAKMEEDTWRAADMNFPVSNVLADKLREKGVRENQITVMHNGINYEDYENIDQNAIRKRYGLEGKTVLGFTGFLREWHKLERVVELISNFSEEESPHLLVVGEGPSVATCKELAATLSVSHRVHFTGFVKREDIPEHLAAMDIALQPAVTDYASPLKIFEYMYSGLAIIAPDQPNIKEILTDQENALFFTPGNFEQIEALILRLVTDKELRDRIGNNAKTTIPERGYIWQENAARIAEISERLIKT
ncbi:glycosyltransferase family 4 protein [Kordiimonas laminariae]|uniref:glycosyltransferase family 4 protein n=1 Tax=Kordiimonas laminariae TaxID=2917717 RepID=UPI001FF1C5A7|nr:glycosyltransferase family 4 protein [Kordiimonas laminariae]